MDSTHAGTAVNAAWSVDGFLFVTQALMKGVMPDPSPVFLPPPIKERKTPGKGIDFPHAYRALIKGFIRVETTRRLKGTQPKENKL